MMNKYRVALKLKDDDHPTYFINVEAESEELAIAAAKSFVATYGHWHPLLSIEKRLEQIEFLYFVND